jgi:hypothetical protein
MGSQRCVHGAEILRKPSSAHAGRAAECDFPIQQSHKSSTAAIKIATVWVQMEVGTGLDLNQPGRTGSQGSDTALTPHLLNINCISIKQGMVIGPRSTRPLP